MLTSVSQQSHTLLQMFYQTTIICAAIINDKGNLEEIPQRRGKYVHRTELMHLIQEINWHTRAAIIKFFNFFY